MQKHIAIILSVLFISVIGNARTKLTTLPQRDMVRIDLKNSGFTLVEEERTINLQKGKNHIEFAWDQTYINKSSIQFRPIKTPGTVAVLNVNYPPNESALYWEVYSPEAGPGVFRISYLISNLHRTISYEAIADKDEKKLRLKSYFTLKNMSGERFINARLELGFGKDFIRSFQRGESKKMLSVKFTDIDVVKSYHYDNAQFGEYVRMNYEIKNTVKNGMGQFPLLPGKVRIFQEDRYGTEAFIGEDWGKYTPRGRTMALYLGQAKEVKVKRSIYKNNTEKVNEVVKNYHQVIKFQVENFKKSIVPLTIHEHLDGEWNFVKIELKEQTGERNQKQEKTINHSQMVNTKKKDINNLDITFNVPHTENKKFNLYVHVVLKNRW